MVKNTKGGCGHKGLARKHNKEATEHKTRLSTDPMEMYAVVTRLFGGQLCCVDCQDGRRRLCVIRGKFRGRRKRDNIVGMFSWVLIGLRDFESDYSSSSSSSVAATSEQEKLPKCDLLEIYSDQDKRSIRDMSEDVYRMLTEKSGTGGHASKSSVDPTRSEVQDCGVDFVDDDGEETYAKLMKQPSSVSSTANANANANATDTTTEEDVSLDFNFEDI